MKAIQATELATSRNPHAACLRQPKIASDPRLTMRIDHHHGRMLRAPKAFTIAAGIWHAQAAPLQAPTVPGRPSLRRSSDPGLDRGGLAPEPLRKLVVVPSVNCGSGAARDHPLATIACKRRDVVLGAFVGTLFRDGIPSPDSHQRVRQTVHVAFPARNSATWGNFLGRNAPQAHWF